MPHGSLPPFRWLPLAAVFFATLPQSPASAQDAPQQTEQKPKYGTVFRTPVDDTVRKLVGARGEDGSMCGGSVLDTARVLTAMGHCHRFYGLSDGPVVQSPMRFLIANRDAAGSFGGGDPETTAWVLEALTVLGDGSFTEEKRAAAEFLRRGGHDASPFASRIAEIAAAGEFPPRSMQDVARAAPAAAASGEWAAAAEGLVDLVACQVLARRYDQGRNADGSAVLSFGKVRQSAVNYLLKHQEDGTFYVDAPQGRFPDLGISALGLAALQTKPTSIRTDEESRAIQQGLESLVSAQNEDGSFGERDLNYITSAAILALARAKDPALQPAIEKARDFLLGIQNTEDRGYSSEDRDYGSIGYGGDQRGDLSNLQFAIQALRASGVSEDHEALQKAIVFLQRTQNLESVNDFERRVRDSDTGEWLDVTSGNDGGSAYYPGNSPAGYVELADGQKIPRSYGSMTYALLKTYTLCGVDGDDPRVQAAVDWIEDNWTLEENPGSDPRLPKKARYQGLYYYYMVLAQALDAAEVQALQPSSDEIVEAAAGSPRRIDWRAALREHLATVQRPDGSFVNDKNGRWHESMPTLCTIYALLALDHAAPAEAAGD
jgi:squalene-hopene/tetraprenyl-beta-curcumene cyclase